MTDQTDPEPCGICKGPTELQDTDAALPLLVARFCPTCDRVPGPPPKKPSR